MSHSCIRTTTIFLCVGLMTACGMAGSGARPKTVLVEQKRLYSELHPSLAAANNPQILYVMLKLRSDTVESDRKIVAALKGLRGFTHIMLKSSSWYETPGAIHNPLVQNAIAICNRKGIHVIWGRNLWVAWPAAQEIVPTIESLFDAAYYAAALATVRSEARALGAAGTFLDVEPYGRSTQMPLKRNALSGEDQRRVTEAVRHAVLNAGRVDLVFPASAPRTGWFVWALNGLGTLHCENRTYYARHPTYNFPTIRPPAEKNHRLDFWGSNVGLKSIRSKRRKFVPLTVSEFKALDLRDIRKQYPACRGTWVYIDYDIFPEVLRSW